MGNKKNEVPAVTVAKRGCLTKAPAQAAVIEPVDAPDDSVRRLLHELQVHQIELEMQNLELSQSRDKGEALLDNYTELYDFAPVGYCTLDRQGVFQRINLTGSNLLGDNRSTLINRSFSQYIADENKRPFNEMLALVFSGTEKKAHCEIVIHPKGLRSPTPVKIVAMASTTGNECLVVIIDITERKRLETEIMAAQDVLELRRVQERSAELLTLNEQLTKEVDRRKKLEETLRDSQIRLRNLSAHLQFVREEERKAIAREVHDELGQMLASIQLGLSLLAADYTDHEKLAGRINIMETVTVDAIKTVQRIASELRPVMLDVLGLADSLEWQSQDFQKRTGIKCSIVVLMMNNGVKPEVAIAIFRIFQEALTNVQRHSQATKVEAYFVERRKYYCLTVRDNGIGITQEEIASPNSIGLIGTRERVYILGGKMKVFGLSGQGTALFVRVPINPKELCYEKSNHR